MSIRFIFGSSAGYFAVSAAERTATVLLIPVMTHFLTPADYGAMLLISNLSSIVNLIFGFSLVPALMVIFSNASSDTERRATCTTILLTIGVILGALHATVALSSLQISIYFLHTPAYQTAIALGALAYFLWAYSLCIVAIGRLTERHRLYPIVQFPALIIQVGLTVWLVAIAMMGVISQYIALATASAITLTVYALVLRHWLSGPFDRHLMVKASRIGAQTLPWQLATSLATNSAAFFLTRSGHVDEAGLFMVANGAAALLFVASASFENVWTPFVLLRKDDPSLPAIQLRIFSIYSSFILMIAAALGLFARELFTVFVGASFQEGYRFLPPLVLAYSVFCFVQTFAQGLQAKERMLHYAWIGMVASGVFLALCLPLVKQAGAMAIIIAIGGSHLAMLILLQSVSNRLLPVPYPWLRHGLMWIVAVVVVAQAYPLPVSWHGTAIKFAALGIIVLLPFLFGSIRMSDLQFAKASILNSSR